MLKQLVNEFLRFYRLNDTVRQINQCFSTTIIVYIYPVPLVCLVTAYEACRQWWIAQPAALNRLSTVRPSSRLSEQVVKWFISPPFHPFPAPNSFYLSVEKLTTCSIILQGQTVPRGWCYLPCKVTNGLYFYFTPAVADIPWVCHAIKDYWKKVGLRVRDWEQRPPEIYGVF